MTQQHHALDSGLHASRLNQSPAGVATWPNIDNGSAKESNGRSSMANIGAMTRFRTSLLQRGLRGVIGLRRVFKILDD